MKKDQSSLRKYTVIPPQEDDRRGLLQRGHQRESKYKKCWLAISDFENEGGHEPESAGGLWKVGVTPAWKPARTWGPQFNKCMELNSANNWIEPGSDILILTCWDLCHNSTLLNWEIINLHCFRHLNMWSFFTSTKENWHRYPEHLFGSSVMMD